MIIFYLATLLSQDSEAPTQQELALAQKFQKAVVSGDLKSFKECLDLDALLERVTRGIGDPKQQQSFRSRMAPKLASSLSEGLKQKVDEGGSYVLLRHRKHRPLYRLVTAEGLNYHEMLPADGGGTYVDIYIGISGEWISETVRRVYASFVAGENGKIEGKDAEIVASAADIVSFQSAVQQREYAEALKLYARLPKNVQREKFLLIPRIQAACNGSDQEYLAAMDDFEKAYPNDPAFLIVSLDALFVRQRYDDELKAIDKLDQSLGGDPYLEIYRGNAHWGAARRNKAKSAVDRAIRAEPTMKEAYWTRITYALEEKEFKVVADLLTVLETKLGEEIADLAQIETYAEFVRSPEHAAWMKARVKK